MPLTDSVPAGAGARDEQKDAGGAPSGQLVYLYAVLPAVADAVGLMREGDIAGMVPGAPLFAITVQDLVAAVSNVPAAVFASEPLNALAADLPRLTPFVVAHEAAVAALQNAAPALVPMTFGAIFAEEAGVRRLLDLRGQEFRELLVRLQGRREWGVKLFCDGPAALAAVNERSAAVQEIVAAAGDAGPGRAYLLRKQQQRVAAAEVDGVTAAACEAVLTEFGAVSVATRREEVAGGQPGAVQLILKAAFLVDLAQADRFEAAAAALVRGWSPRGFRVDVSGPWAPYSFVGAPRGG